MGLHESQREVNKRDLVERIGGDAAALCLAARRLDRWRAHAVLIEVARWVVDGDLSPRLERRTWAVRDMLLVQRAEQVLAQVAADPRRRLHDEKDRTAASLSSTNGERDYREQD